MLRGRRPRLRCLQPGRPGVRELPAARQEPGQAPQYARSWVDELNARGYSVCGVDQQGLGYSEGVRGYVERFADYVTDVLQFAKCASGHPAPAMLAGAGSRHLVQPKTSCSLLAHRRCCLWHEPGYSRPVLVASPRLSLQGLWSEACDAGCCLIFLN